MLNDLPSISPRSLVKYLDSYVVGQTKAKKVLAVGVWNHYLRVASNQRMKDEAEARMMADAEAEAAEAAAAAAAAADADAYESQEVQQDVINGKEEAGRSLRLGKMIDKDSWTSHAAIKEERNAEKKRDEHGEAARSLMFGRARESGWSTLVDRLRSWTRTTSSSETSRARLRQR